MDIRVEKKNEVFLQIFCSQGIRQEIYEHFSFFIENYKYNPKVKSKMWDGRIHMLSLRTSEMYIGLIHKLVEFCNERDYSIQIGKGIISSNHITDEQVAALLKSFNLHIKNEDGELLPAEFRHYQVSAIAESIREKRILLLSPTSSGKSAVIYAMIRFFSMMQPDRKILLIVPSTHLVEQMYGDFAIYSHNNKDWKVENECTRVYSGMKYEDHKRVVISTWQSAMNLDSIWFKQFKMMIQDECHQGKATEIKGILERTVNARWRIGTTGTLDDIKCNKMVLEGLLGPVFKVITSKELRNEGSAAEMKIKAIILNHGDNERKAMARKKYVDEVNFITSHKARNEYIKNLALSLDNNTVIMYNFVEKHGLPLYESLKAEANKYNKQVYFISGDTSVDERERIRDILENNTNVIVVASFGTFSTGNSVRNIHYIINSFPSKSRIRVLQTIGRGGRLHRDKIYLVIFDIVDNLEWGKWKNHTLKQFANRLGYYVSEKIDYKIHQVELNQPKGIY